MLLYFPPRFWQFDLRLGGCGRLGLDGSRALGPRTSGALGLWCHGWFGSFHFTHICVFSRQVVIRLSFHISVEFQTTLMQLHLEHQVLSGSGSGSGAGSGSVASGYCWEQINTRRLPCHPDRLTIKLTKNIQYFRMPRGCWSDQPRVTVGLSGWSAFNGVCVCVCVCVCVFVSDTVLDLSRTPALASNLLSALCQLFMLCLFDYVLCCYVIVVCMYRVVSLSIVWLCDCLFCLLALASNSTSSTQHACPNL